MKKWILGLGLVSLCGCGPKPDSTNTLRFRYWGDLQETHIITDLIHEFESAHPGVHIKPELKFPPAPAYAEVLMAEFAANRAPDVIFCVAEIKDLLTESNLLEDMEPYLAQEKDFSKKDFYPSIVQRFSVDGHLVVLPRDIAPFACVYYNQHLFDRAGLPYPKDSWNWEDLRKDAIKISKLKSENGDRIFGFDDDWTMPEAWVLSAGGQMVDNTLHPHRFVFASPEGISGYQYRWNLMFKDRAMPSGGDMQALSGGSTGMFLNGNLGMFYSGIWKTPSFREIHGFDWNVAMFPKGPTGKRGFLTGGSGYGMRRGLDQHKKDLAWEFIKFMTGPLAETRMASTGLAQPALRKVAASSVFLDGQRPFNKGMLLKAAEIATHPPATSKWLKFGNEIDEPIMGKMWIPGFDAKDLPATVKEAQDKANLLYFSPSSN